ncbi:MAG: DNA repair protein RecN [Burkholderiaceae bacterium]
MLRRLSLKDFVIVEALELEFGPGLSVLTGETGAGKSILIDALQLALGARAEVGVVREGCARSEIAAEFDSPPSLAGWLEDAGFAADDALLLRRVVDAQGRSRAFVNGGAATLAQLREAADHLIDIHGQHAWQSLTRPAAVRALLDEQAEVDAAPVAAAWADWSRAAAALADAHARQGELETERERLVWQLGEIDRLAPAGGEWAALSAEHGRLAHAQALTGAAQQALEDVSEGEASALRRLSRAASALRSVADHDPALAPMLEALDGAEAQLQDAAHGLSGYLSRTDLDPGRLGELDDRMSSWMGLARRFRRRPEDLPALQAEWRGALAALDAAADPAHLRRRVDDALALWRAEAARVSARRAAAAPRMAARVTEAMQQLGMDGGRFDVALAPQAEPQPFGAETVEFLVAGHAGSTPRPLAKVASGGELSRLALAIAVTAARSTAARASGTGTGAPTSSAAVGTLIFDEIDSGVGGTVADAVGRLMKRLGRHAQVLAVTHLPQVAACGDHHFVVAKRSADGRTTSGVVALNGESRVAEVARMLGGERGAGTSLAHAQELISRAVAADAAGEAPPRGPSGGARAPQPARRRPPDAR